MKKLKEFQVSYKTLLFMAKVKEYGYGMCSMTEKGEYYNETLNDKVLDVLDGIMKKANNFFLTPSRRLYNKLLSMYLPAHSILFKFLRIHMCPYNAYKTYQIWANSIYGAFTVEEQLEIIDAVNRSGYGVHEATKCADFAWKLLEDEKKYIPIISDIQCISARLNK